MRGWLAFVGSWIAGGVASALPPDSLPPLLTSYSESPALSERLQHPWNQFLLNGETVYGAGAIFYAEQRFSSEERFSLMPEFQILPAFPSGDTVRAAYGAKDGHELASPPSSFNGGFLRARVTSLARVAVEGDEDDLYSYLSLPRRIDVLGNGSPAGLSYLGSDLPPLSLLRGGVELSQRGGTMQVGYARGYDWGQSQLTGEAYPLEVQGTEIRAGVAEDLSMRFRYYQYDGASSQREFSPQATLSEVGLTVKENVDSSWGYRLDWTYRKRVVENGSAWTPLNRISYPWSFHAGKEWKGDDFPWKARVQADLDYDESVLLTHGTAEAEEPVNQNVFSQGIRLYQRHVFDDSAFIGETDPDESLLGRGLRCAIRRPRRGRMVGIRVSRFALGSGREGHRFHGMVGSALRYFGGNRQRPGNLSPKPLRGLSRQ